MRIALVLAVQAAKPVPSMLAFSQICNEVEFRSFQWDKREVAFSRLDQHNVHVVGLFGYTRDVWRGLHDEGEDHMRIAFACTKLCRPSLHCS